MTLLVVSETAALSGDIYKEDYFTVDIKDITAIEYALDEINRKQIKIFAKNRGITKLNTHFNETSIETVLEMTISKNTEPEQIKSLIKSWKHLIKICGGKDLSKDQF